MFDISWSEVMIFGAVALIFIGPKDLPVVLRTLGKYLGAARKLYGEFQGQLDGVMNTIDPEQTSRREAYVSPQAARTPEPVADIAVSSSAFDAAVRAATRDRIFADAAEPPAISNSGRP